VIVAAGLLRLDTGGFFTGDECLGVGLGTLYIKSAYFLETLGEK
jgi:hypothetical protein